jgi:DNA-binding protein H-NS
MVMSKPIHMVESISEKELIVLQRQWQSNEKRINELLNHQQEIDKLFDKIDQGKVLISGEV